MEMIRVIIQAPQNKSRGRTTTGKSPIPPTPISQQAANTYLKLMYWADL